MRRCRVDDLLVERVLVAVEQVPRGRVVSYGDIAALVGIGPRQVGTVMRQWGGTVAWWRVVSASGDLPAHLRERARREWGAEGITCKPNGSGCRITAHRADLTTWAQQVRAASAHLVDSRA